MDNADYVLALSLQNEFDEELNCSISANTGHSTTSCGILQDRRKCIVDPEWELVDPNPDIHTLFNQFNKTYFWNTLTSVEVRWSPRMTLCAGLCCYEGEGGLCSVRLSQPLLKLRPRLDLVETLLHEMIHAYLFVTANDRDRDGHGPEFCKHMRRINSSAGTNITIYHNFGDEVDEQRKHWWRCRGTCRSKPPYFGYVKRAMNRAPSKNDTWWSQHQRECGGTFEKIKEPDGYGMKKNKMGGSKPSNTHVQSRKTHKDRSLLQQSTIKFPTNTTSAEGGHLLGGESFEEHSKRCIPSTSRLLTMFDQKRSFDELKTANSTSEILDVEKKRKRNANNLFQYGLSHKKKANGVYIQRFEKHNKRGHNLTSVCQHIRRSGAQSVNENAVAFQRFKVVTKFLTTKEQNSKIDFSSDDEFSDFEDEDKGDIPVLNRKKNGLFDKRNGFKTGHDLSNIPSKLRPTCVQSLDDITYKASEEHVMQPVIVKSRKVLLTSKSLTVDESVGKRKLSGGAPPRSSTFRSPSKKKPNLRDSSESEMIPSNLHESDDIPSTSSRSRHPLSPSTFLTSQNSFYHNADDDATSLTPFSKSLRRVLPDSSSSEDDDVLLSSVIRNEEKHDVDVDSCSADFKDASNSVALDPSMLPTTHDHTINDSTHSPGQIDSFQLPNRVSCPVCNELVFSDEVNNHIDSCLSLKAIRDSSF